MSKSKMLLPVFLFIFLNPAFAQEEDDKPLDLRKSHSISINMGFKTGSNTIVDVSSMDVDVNTGFIGSLTYCYWFRNEWSVNFQLGVYGANVDTRIFESNSNSIGFFLIGCRYYPEVLSLGNVGRLYGGLNIGPYIGSKFESESWLRHRSIHETVFGINPNFGLDLFVTKWLKFGPGISYHIISNFKSLNLGRLNDNQLEFTLNFGIVL